MPSQNFSHVGTVLSIDGGKRVLRVNARDLTIGDDTVP